MGKLSLGLKYIKYKLFSKHKKGFGIHSPFLYNLIRNIFNNKSNYYAMDEVAELRYDLLENIEKINVKDFGAGSKTMKSNTRKVKDIVKHSAINEKFGEMLFRLIENFKPQTILELGTSLGLGTLYLAKPNKNVEVYTIEACPETASKASENFKECNANNIKQIIGNINNELPVFLKDIDQVDFVYFDGNHQKEATLNYFKQCLLKAHNNTIFYFDDIHWSKGMEEAWIEIKKHKDVTLTVDLFFSGIVFFRNELSKQDFVIRF